MPAWGKIGALDRPTGAVGGTKHGDKLGGEAPKDGLPVQAFRGTLMGAADDRRAVQEADLFQGSERTAHPRLRHSSKGSMASESAAVHRERPSDTAGRGPKAGQQHRERQRRRGVAEAAEIALQPLQHGRGEPVGSR